MMRVAVFTSGRQDWGLLRPVFAAARNSSRIQLVLIAGGMHVRMGQAPSELDGYPVAEFVDGLQASDRPCAVAQTAGWTTALLAGALERCKADALLLAGDRTETLAAALAATCLCLPIVHLHGGEESAGAIDNACRHAITKLAHLHAVAHEDYARRLVRMGERPERVYITGAPGLDGLLHEPLMPANELARSLGLAALRQPLVLLTLHPATLGATAPEAEAAAVVAGLQRALHGRSEAQVVVTAANSDTGGQAINACLKTAVASDSRMCFAEALGAARYHALMAHASVMLGNSSSGILEAPSFDLPVVNVGERQHGRLRIGRVQDVPADAQAIEQALQVVLAVSETLPRIPRPTAFGTGHAARRIVEAMEALAAEPAAQRMLKAPVPLAVLEESTCAT